MTTFNRNEPKSFFVYLASDAPGIWAQNNTSNSFRTRMKLPFLQETEFDFNAYSVGLVDIFYGDNFSPPSLQQLPPIASSPLDWFKVPLGTHQIDVQTHRQAVHQITKTTNLFNEFENTLQEKVSKIPEIHKILRIGDAGGYRTELQFEPELPVGDEDTSYHLDISPGLAEILGFLQTRFEPGKYLSDVHQSVQAFEKAELNTTWTLTVWTTKNLPIEVEFDLESNTLSSALRRMQLTLESYKINVAFVMDPDNKFLVVSFFDESGGQESGMTKLMLPSFFNKQLGLDEEYVFDRLSTVVEIPQDKPNRDFVFDSIIVTCSIVEDSQIGEINLGILKIFPRAGGGYKRHRVDFSPVMYTSLKQQQLPDIMIQILDKNFQLLPRSKTPTFLTLHFKRKTSS